LPFRIWSVIVVLGMSLCMTQDTVADASTSQNAPDAATHYRDAESHRHLALKYLQEAADQTLSDRLGQAQIEFDRAAEEYLACASSIDDKDNEATRIVWSASGLLASYHAPAALKLILAHPAVQHDPEIQRIKADALLALGLGKEAALAYEQWIGLGKCNSPYRNWPGEPQMGHPFVLLMPKGTDDPCAALAPELRARLETLHRLFGHPNNLPRKNYETSPKDTN
jgi:hypothetical protein